MTQEATEKIFPANEEANLDIMNTRGSVQIHQGFWKCNHGVPKMLYWEGEG